MSKYILCSHVLVLYRADVLRPTEQSLAAISRQIAEADGQGGVGKELNDRASHSW